MRRNEQTLGEAIKEMLRALRLDDKLNESKLIHSWEEIVGKMIANHTRDIYIKNKKLIVKLDSPALKNELSYSKTKMLKTLNDAAGEEVITDIIFT